MAAIEMDLFDDSGFFNRVLDSDLIGTRVAALSYRNTQSDVVSVVVRVRLVSSTTAPSTVSYDLSIACELCLAGVWRSLVDDDTPPRELRYPVLTRPDRTLEYRIQWGGMSRRRQADSLCNMDTLRCPDGVTRVANGDCDFAPCSGSSSTYGCVRDWRAWLTLLTTSTSSVQVALWQTTAVSRTICGVTWLGVLNNTDPVSNFQTLSRQYIAARLNMFVGADAASVYNIMVQASLLLRQHCPLPNNVQAFWSQSDADLAWLLTSSLTQYNFAIAGNGNPPLCSANSAMFGSEGNLNSLRDLPLPTVAPPPAPPMPPGGTPAPPTGPLVAVPIGQLGDPYIVSLGSRWYLTLTPQSGDSWRQLGFTPNSSWTQQRSPFTYGESSLTNVGYVFPSVPGDQYYRQEFSFTDQQLAQTVSGILRVASDDHADVWINNILVLDDHGDHEYKYWNEVVVVSRSVLRAGINVVTAINRNALPSSDSVFEAEFQLNYSSSIVANVPSPTPSPTPSPLQTPSPSPRPPSTVAPTPPTPSTPIPTMLPTSCFLDSQSALGFVPQPIQGLPLNQSFVIGTLVHYNCPIVGGYVSEVELTIPIRFTSGVFDGSARFQLQLHETSNTATTDGCPYPSTVPCSDRLQWASLTTLDSFVVNNRRFALTLLGFSRNADPTRFSLVSQFYSEERQSNIAYLVATLKEAPLCDSQFDVCNVCGGDGSSCAPFGCDGVRGSGLEYDRCGVCNGGNRCVDCAGVLFGTRQYDRCNVCNGNGQSCLDCRAVLFGTARYDQCDVCGGNGVSCLDCSGVPFGTKVIDVCGVCGGNGRGCTLTYDCFGVLNGTARRDVCGVCNGNGRSCVDCRGVVNGTAVVDWCNVCGGDGSSCVDCAGVRYGTNVRDKCGVCGGNNSSCRGCDGVPLSGFVYDPCGVCQRQLPDGSFASLSCVSGCDRRPFAPYKTIDKCGVCGGSNTCLDCAGTPHGTARYDRCDVCAGDGTRCIDCAGVPFGDAKYNICGECVLGGANRRRQATERPLESCITGCDLMPWSTKVYDVCGVCGGNGKSCLDCKLVPNGTSRYDVCGVCGGDNRSCRDCRGVVNGPARYDACGVCNGNSSTCRDCLGVVNGGNSYDKCGICGGANKCLDCNGTPHGDAVYNVCDVCVGATARKRVVECLDCAGVPFGTRKYDACDVCGGNNSTCPRTEAPSSPASSSSSSSSTVMPRTEEPQGSSTSSSTTSSTTSSTSTSFEDTSSTSDGSTTPSATTSTSTTSTSSIGTQDNGAIRGGQTGDGIDLGDGANSSSNAATVGAVIGTLLGLALLGGGVLTALWLRRRSLRSPKSVDNNPVFEQAIGDEEL
jgi:hypothetical protein